MNLLKTDNMTLLEWIDAKIKFEKAEAENMAENYDAHIAAAKHAAKVEAFQEVRDIILKNRYA